VTAPAPQGSPEWIAARLGRVTASRVADVIARTKSGPAASRTNYAAELIAERLTGRPAERYRSAEMIWGSETEPLARAAYSFRCDVDVEPAGFVDHPGIAMSGASPDGLVGAEGLVEIKCPNTATHIDTLLRAHVPEKYVSQMQFQMACTGRAWCDFVSFDPRLPEPMRSFVARVVREEPRILALEGEVERFLAELAARIERLREAYENA
jgi:putative phage-type endonuclease